MGHVSSVFSPRLSRKDLVFLATAVLIGSGIFLAAAAVTLRLGFPLDDSWIHVTYARNLALHRQWAFRMGEPSAGSTAPLWTLLLVPGFWLGLAPNWWSYLLGAALLLGLSITVENAARVLLPAYRPAMPWAGLFIAGEWHLIWAAVSGMETLLHALLLTGVLALLITGSRRYLSLGVLTGLSVWARPDGVTLAGPVLLTIFLVENGWRERARAVGSFIIGLGALVLPYFLVNLLLSGRPFPNTFYAKQVEYAAWQARPLLYRTGLVSLQMLTGPTILLLPGVVGSTLLIIRRRQSVSLVALLWCAAYVLMYALRLPPYQHGRYIMPAMPVLFLFGLLGYFEFQKSKLFEARHFAIQTAWQLSLIMVSLGFLALGARAYAQDVGLIETEMVDAAKWVAHNLPKPAVIAAHDIGALGYFDDHELVDLAGLVSPEVLPFMRDELRLAEFLDYRKADYLITFPSFYPALMRAAQPVYSTGGRFAPAMGEQNMTVYCWSCP